jgi:hypothetical protein
VIKESRPDASSAEMLQLFSSMDEQTKEIMVIQMRALAKRGALNILPICIGCGIVLNKNGKSVDKFGLGGMLQSDRKLLTPNTFLIWRCQYEASKNYG